MKDSIKRCMSLRELTNPNGYPQFNYKMERVVVSENFSIAELIKDFSGRKYTPTAGDKIFFLSGCNVPRFKVKQFCEKYNVALVKYIEKATAKFIGPNVLAELFTNFSDYKLDKAFFKKYLHDVIGDTDPRYMTFLKDLNDSEPDYVMVNHGFIRQLEEKTFFQLKLFRGSNAQDVERTHKSYFYRKMFADENAYNMVESMLNDPTYYNQDDVLKVLNTGTVLTADMLDNIRRLFESKDVQNTKLGMELLSNCDFEASAVPILLLIREFGQKMYDSGNRNHVNFKSLISFFNIKNMQNLSYDDIIECLRCQKLLTPMNLQMLTPQIKQYMSENAKMKHFEVKDIEPSNEVKMGLADSITDQMNSGIENNVEIVDCDDDEELKISI